MAGIGRTRVVGQDRRNLFRLTDRNQGSVKPKTVHHASQLPPAREYPGRIMYVGGIDNQLYFSNGTIWTAL